MSNSPLTDNYKDLIFSKKLGPYWRTLLTNLLRRGKESRFLQEVFVHYFRELLNGLDHMIGQATYGIVFAVIAMFVAYNAAETGSVSWLVWSVVLLGAVPIAIAMRLEIIWVFSKKACRQE